MTAPDRVAGVDLSLVPVIADTLVALTSLSDLLTTIGAAADNPSAVRYVVRDALTLIEQQVMVLDLEAVPFDPAFERGVR